MLMSAPTKAKPTTVTVMQRAKTPMVVLLVIVMSDTKEQGQHAAVSKRFLCSESDICERKEVSC